MIDHRLSRQATGARTPRAAVLLGVVLSSLVGCSAGGPSGTDSVVAIEQAQEQAAAEVAEAQEAIDRQVEAADAQKAKAEAAAAAAAQRAAAARAAESAAAQKAAAGSAAAQKAAAAQKVATKPGVQTAAPRKVAAATTRPTARTPASAVKATPRGTSAQKVLPPPAAPPVVTRPARAAAAPKPTLVEPKPAATGTAGPTPDTVPSTDDLHVVLAPGGAVRALDGESVVTGCEPQGFQPGDPVRLVDDSGLTVHETVLPPCQRQVLSAPGTEVDHSAPHFTVTLPEIAWRDGEAWILEIGAHRWPVTASMLDTYAWSVAVSTETGVTAGPEDPLPAPAPAASR